VVLRVEAAEGVARAVVLAVAAAAHRLAQLQQQPTWTAAAARPLSLSEGASMCRPVMVL
jgi:hypothetical protein